MDRGFTPQRDVDEERSNVPSVQFSVSTGSHRSEFVADFFHRVLTRNVKCNQRPMSIATFPSPHAFLAVVLMAHNHLPFQTESHLFKYRCKQNSCLVFVIDLLLDSFINLPTIWNPVTEGTCTVCTFQLLPLWVKHCCQIEMA